jgi:DNA polymerase III psi subunit
MLSTNQYLDLMGITQWQLRSDLSPVILIPACVQPQSQWLFIMEKQEVMLDSPLFSAILAAINQTPQTITVAYYDESPTTKTMPLLPALRYIVVMGELPAQQLQLNRQLFASDIPVILSDNLATLADNTTSKRTLWQQLKRHQS